MPPRCIAINIRQLKKRGFLLFSKYQYLKSVNNNDQEEEYVKEGQTEQFTNDLSLFNYHTIFPNR